jgi:hypothetical protein
VLEAGVAIERPSCVLEAEVPQRHVPCAARRIAGGCSRAGIAAGELSPDSRERGGPLSSFRRFVVRFRFPR